jgi:PqqA peptide cyclase
MVEFAIDHGARRVEIAHAQYYGWGMVNRSALLPSRASLNVTPSGKVLPCHGAESIPGLGFWNVRERSLADIWRSSPAFDAFRGTDWMREPCRSCARKEVDFGGCRCQALALTGDARETDPVCCLSPRHDAVADIASGPSHDDRHVGFIYRKFAGPSAPLPVDVA